MNTINYIPNDLMSMILSIRSDEMKKDKYKKDYDKVMHSLLHSIRAYKSDCLHWDGPPDDKYQEHWYEWKGLQIKRMNVLDKNIYEPLEEEMTKIIDTIELYDFGYCIFLTQKYKPNNRFYEINGDYMGYNKLNDFLEDY